MDLGSLWFLSEHVFQGNDVRYWCHGQRCPSVTYDIMCGVGDNTLCVFHSVYTLIFHTPTDLPLHAGTEDLLLLVDVYYLVWLAGGKPWFSMLVKTTSRQINLHVSCP